MLYYHQWFLVPFHLYIWLLIFFRTILFIFTFTAFARWCSDFHAYICTALKTVYSHRCFVEYLSMNYIFVQDLYSLTDLPLYIYILAFNVVLVKRQSRSRLSLLCSVGICPIWVAATSSVTRLFFGFVLGAVYFPRNVLGLNIGFEICGSYF